jgi:hypothetical protein
MEYINRRGETYFAFQGVTKTGKPKYFASKKLTSLNATRAEALPVAFEFFENPANAMVVIRRRKKSILTIAEKNLLSRLALEHSQARCEVIIDGDSLVVYAGPVCRVNPMLEAMLPGASKRFAENANLEPVFRFTLVDAKDRHFKAERYCYRSSIDGWWSLCCVPAPLEVLAEQYLPHLQQDSFFDLI